MNAFKHDLHAAVTTAIIQTVEKHKATPHLYQDVREYLESAAQGARLGLSFCPDNALLLENLRMEKGVE